MNNSHTIFDGMIVFCAVVENEGFTAAARALGHTPSHVSKEIARLDGDVSKFVTPLVNEELRKRLGK